MQYAGFWRRVAASMIDSLILLVASWVFVMIHLAQNGLSAQDVQGVELQVIGTMAYGCLAFPYWSISHFRWGRSIGKRVLGVKVVDAKTGGPLGPWQAMGRTVATILSGLLFAMGYAMAGWNKRKRSLHDWIAGTVCVKS